MWKAAVVLGLGLALAPSAIAGVQEDPLAERLAGGWRDVSNADSLLGFDGDRCVSSWDGQQSVFGVVYGVGVVTRTPYRGGPEIVQDVAFDGERLVLRAEGVELVYERLPELPDAVRLDPLPLGSRTPDDEEREAFLVELRARTVRDQDVRESFSGAMAAARRDGRLDDPADYQAFMQGDEMRILGEDMRAVDRDNTAWLMERLLDVGWIDSERFGSRAAEDAFLIVQHSGNLRLMRTALPLIEDEARADRSMGQLYALLHDRAHLALGEPQRYGTQLAPDEEGVLHVTRLEDPDGVDARRADLGMSTLDAYLDLYRGRGQQVVIDPAPPGDA